MADEQTDEEHATVGELRVVMDIHHPSMRCQDDGGSPSSVLVQNNTSRAKEMDLIHLWGRLDLFSRFAFSLISGKKNIEEKFAASLAPAVSLWTTDARGAVRLRIEEGCPEEPITVHQMFNASVEKYGNMHALASKKNNTWEKITFSEYYQFCRRAAKSFIKVCYPDRKFVCSIY